MIEFNVNDYCWIKLTDVGRKELLRQHRELYKETNGFIGEYVPPQEDSEGWSKWQMHSLMSHFGYIMGNGFDVPFETTIRINCEKL